MAQTTSNSTSISTSTSTSTSPVSPNPAPTKAQIIHAPSREPIRHTNKSVFLAGTTTNAHASDWRAALAHSLAHLPSLTIINPYRADWDASWREDEAFAPFREQVEWELDMQEAADLVVLYFHPDTTAVVSLLELGLAAGGSGGGKRKDAIVVCPDGYWKKGNVSILCRRFAIEVLDDVDQLKHAIVSKLELKGTGHGN